MSLSTTPNPSKLQAWKRGRMAEPVRAWVLRLKGYRIRARTYKTSVGEIDIIAQRGNILVFIEVKARATTAAAAESIRFQQQQRITRAAQVYIANFPKLSNINIRFDAMLMAPGRLPDHIKGAWRHDP
ncbi:MAG: YraN family protein [Rhodospirillales bacterium]